MRSASFLLPSHFWLENVTTLAKSGLVFNDGKRVFNAVGRTKRWIPQFINNDSQHRCVLMEATVSWAFHGRSTPPEILRDLEALKDFASQHQGRRRELGCSNAEMVHWNKMAAIINAVDQAGGYMQLLAGISYRAWRLRWHDEDIADHFQLSTETVKQIRLRLIAFAQRLGFETYSPRPEFVEARDARQALIRTLWQQGRTVSQIAEQVPCCRREVYFVLHKDKAHERRVSERSGVENCPKCGKPYEVYAKQAKPDRFGVHRQKRKCRDCFNAYCRDRYRRSKTFVTP